MEKLFSEFHPADAASWKAMLEKDLKGITFDQLSVIDRNEITIQPFYTPEDINTPPSLINITTGWDICTLIPVNDALSGNKTALNELNNGATGIFFDIKNTTDIALLLKDIELPYIYSCFRLYPGQEDLVKQLKRLLSEKNQDFGAMNTFLYHDYISNYLQTGTIGNNDQEFSLELFKETGIIGIDAGLFLNAGATTTYELACSLALTNEYLHILNENHQLDKLRKLHITLSADTSFFEQISKFRAFRKLLDLLCTQYNCAPTIHIHAGTAHTYRSPFDSYSNLLRDTIAGMAAVIGGCNSLYIYPFNESIGAQDDFGRRMSRNQQLIFREESYLDKVADAGAGSYYIETLTEELASKSWDLFKEIEAEGGLLAAFDKEIITQNIRQQAVELIREYKEGKRILIGVNKFPNPKDEPIQTEPAKETFPGKAIRPLSLTQAILQPQ